MATKRRYKRRTYRKKKRTQKRRVRGGIKFSSTPLGQTPKQLLEKKNKNTTTTNTNDLCTLRKKEVDNYCNPQNNYNAMLCTNAKKLALDCKNPI